MSKTDTILEDAAATSTHNAGGGPDAALIAACNAATALFERIRGWDDETVPNPGDDAAQEIMERAWDMASEAMAMEPATLAGARVQVALLLAIHATGDGPSRPAIELPPLRALLRLLPAH